MGKKHDSPTKVGSHFSLSTSGRVKVYDMLEVYLTEAAETKVINISFTQDLSVTLKLTCVCVGKSTQTFGWSLLHEYDATCQHALVSSFLSSRQGFLNVFSPPLMKINVMMTLGTAGIKDPTVGQIKDS